MPPTEDPVEVFRDLAASYCSLVEHIEQHELEDVVRRLSTLLPQLIHVATQLPDLEPDPDMDAPGISHDVWLARFQALDARLGPLGDYWTTMDVHAAKKPKAVNLPLADDLADIWRDLSGGLRLLAEGGALPEVVWEWRYGFEAHWGEHAVEALRAIHAARQRLAGRSG